MKENSVSRQYILTTPVKNEEKNLPKLIESVLKQTVKPILWVIVDDGSTDKSPEIIKETKEKYDWIQSIRLDNVGRDRTLHLATVMKHGFDFSIDYCRKNGIKYSYLGNVDADITLEKTYFEILIKKFERNPKLGIASGRNWLINGDQIIDTKLCLPAGGNIIYKKKCFMECGGIPVSYDWESVLNVKAKLRGWEIKTYNDCRAFWLRDYCYAGNLWNEYKKVGEGAYYLNYNFFYAIVKGFTLISKKPYYIGLAYLCGYLNSIMYKMEQIKDKEIKHYFWYIRPQEIIKRYYFYMQKKIHKRK